MWLGLVHKRLFLIVILVAAIAGLGVSFTSWYSERSLHQQVEAEISRLLPPKIQQSDSLSLGDPGVASVQIEHIEQDLAAIDVSGFIVNSCEVLLQTFDGRVVNNASSDSLISVSWQSNSQNRNLELALNCELASGKLWASQLLLAFAAALLVLGIPTPLSSSQLELASLLRDEGLPEKLVDQISRKSETSLIPKTERPWFVWAIQKGFTFETALEIARRGSELRFDLRNNQVTIHGITVELSPTPFIYYYWYASCRVEPALADAEGWFTNPPSNRPDRVNAELLIEMMTEHGGHMKAINDLRKKGLRAKILDQNRSKIKDELTSVFGEELSTQYLFEVIRDPSTARYRYRLALDPAQVLMETDDKAVIRNPPLSGR